MHEKDQEVEFHGLKKWIKKGEYLVSIMANDGTIWTYTSKTMPIFNFATTKIFQAQESGIAEVKGIEKGDTFYFSIQGIKVSKVYDFVFQEDMPG